MIQNTMTSCKSCTAVDPKVGEVWLVNIPNAIGHQQRGIRPFVVTSNNKRNHYSPTVKGMTMTSQVHKQSPVHVLLKRDACSFLAKDSVVNCEEVTTINKDQFIRRMGKLNDAQMNEIAMARVTDEPFLYAAFLNNVQASPKFKEYSLYS